MYVCWLQLPLSQGLCDPSGEGSSPEPASSPGALKAYKGAIVSIQLSKLGKAEPIADEERSDLILQPWACSQLLVN